MKKIYLVSFQIGDFWHSNLCVAGSADEVANYYKKYEGVYITEGSEGDLKEAETKGKPITRL